MSLLAMSGSALASTVCNTLPPANSDSKRFNNSTTRNSFISLLEKCNDIKQIQSVHAQIIRNGQQKDPFVMFKLLCLCQKFNSIDYATMVFHSIADPNVYLYTALIDGLIYSCAFVDAIELYFEMVSDSILPDKYVMTSVLKACGLQLALREGKQVHGQVLKSGLSSNRSIMLKLIELYGKCGEFEDAVKVFNKMPKGDIVASTVMLSSYFEHDFVEEATNLFNGLKTRDTVCWTAMINGLVRNGEFNKALEIFREMQRQDVRANEVTIVCVLSACSQLGALELGRWVHMYVDKCRIQLNQYVGGALITMYSRCGDIDKARQVFNSMKQRDVSTYNNMIAGLAMHGKGIEGTELFQQMIKCGFRPNSISFVAVLNACSHGGFVQTGYKIFDSMLSEYGIEPQIEHYGCLVDILCRAGRLEEAYEFIQRMQVAPDYAALCTLLNACKIHGKAELGEHVAKFLSGCHDADSGTYTVVSNFYASLGRWKEAAQARSKMKDVQIRKEPGCSSIEVDNVVHEFILGDLRHPQKKEIYEKLKELNNQLKLHGYLPEKDCVLHDIDEKQKEWALSIHSEKLATCYGLIAAEPYTTLRIVKNLRVCNDCHSFLKLIAKITRRKIVVRDRRRFHHFENGLCSCGDYW